MFAYSRFTHAYTKSYFKFTEPVSQDWSVAVNGEEVPVYTCRLSAFPYNRVWTDHQRTYDQTEGASFVNLVSDGAEPLRFTVKTALPHKEVRLRPRAAGVTVTEAEGSAEFTVSRPGHYVLEADSYHHLLYIFVGKPVPAPAPGEVTHFFGPGIHFPGRIVLHSGDSVYVDRDAMVYGCILAEDAEHIRIFGNGILDDSGEERFSKDCYEAYTIGNVKFYDCRGIRIEGVGLRNSAIWCVNLFHCFDVSIDGVRVFGQWRYNTDGIDIVNSQRVTVRDSFIHSFDDTITVKGIDRYADTDNRGMLFENCVLWCDWGKTCEIGLETACRTCSDITFRGCDILRAGNTAFDIQNGDCAEISGIVFEDCSVEYDPAYTQAEYQHSDDAPYTKRGTVEIASLLSVANHRFRSPQNAAMWGLPERLLCNIGLSGIEYAGVHDIAVRRIRVFYPDGMPLRDGKPVIPVRIASVVDGVRYRDITVEDVTVNGVPLTAGDADLQVSSTERFIFR